MSTYSAALLPGVYAKFNEKLVSERFWPPAFRDDIAELALRLGGACTSLAIVITKAHGAGKQSDIVAPVQELMNLETVTTRRGVIDVVRESYVAWEAMSKLNTREPGDDSPSTMAKHIGGTMADYLLFGNFKKEYVHIRSVMEETCEMLWSARLPRVYTVPAVPGSGEKPVLVARRSSIGPALGLAAALGLLWTFRKS